MIYLLFFYTHYTVRGGPSSHGAICGAFYVGAYIGAGNAYWNIGAALSFKPYIHIMLFVVVLLALVHLVVHFVLMRPVISPLQTGALVLL